MTTEEDVRKLRAKLDHGGAGGEGAAEGGGEGGLGRLAPQQLARLGEAGLQPLRVAAGGGDVGPAAAAGAHRLTDLLRQLPGVQAAPDEVRC